MRFPRVVVRHDRVDALVEVEDAARVGAGHPDHDLRAAVVIVRMRQAVRVAELAQDHGKGVTAFVQAAGDRPDAAGDVEDAMPCSAP